MIPLLTSAYLAPIHYYTKLLAGDVVVEEHCDHYVKQTYRNRCVIGTADGALALSIPVEGRPKAEGGDSKTPTGEMRISEHGRWRELHWNALVAAYDRTPYFEYYADDFAAIYHAPCELLVDFNTQLQNLVLRLLGISPLIVHNTSDYLLLDEEGHLKDAAQQHHLHLEWLSTHSKAVPNDNKGTTPGASSREDVGAASAQKQTTMQSEAMKRTWQLSDFRETLRPKIDFRADATFMPKAYYQVFAERHGFLPNLSIVDLLFHLGPESRAVLKACFRDPKT